MSGEAGAGVRSKYFQLYFSTGMTVSVAVPPWEENNSQYISNYFKEASKPFEEKLENVFPKLEELFETFVEENRYPLTTVDSATTHIDGVIIEDTEDHKSYKDKELMAKNWFIHSENPISYVTTRFVTPLLEQITLTIHIVQQIKRSELNQIQKEILQIFSET